MRPYPRRALRSAIAMSALVLAAACNATVTGAPLPSTGISSVPPTTSASTERPAGIDLSDRSPCDAIAKTDYSKLGIEGAGKLDPHPGPMPDSRLCIWSSDVAGVGVYYVVGEGVDAWGPGKRRSTTASVDPVAGFPVYSLSPPLVPGDCNLLVDVHDGQYLTVDVTPSTDHESSDPCYFAREVVESVLTNVAGG
jgi:uncharacterized protein DUF3558